VLGKLEHIDVALPFVMGGKGVRHRLRGLR
jgi:hypothetical protein